jgi:hypothetical protein
MLQGVPEFWYRLGKRTIRERVIAKAAGGFELQVQSEGDSTPLEWKVSGQDAGAVTVAKEKSGRLTVSFADRPEPSMPEFVPSTGKKKSH